jgi:hypothetical protein
MVFVDQTVKTFQQDYRIALQQQLTPPMKVNKSKS